ncbi:MAG TPA: caspase family protein [Syntrophales bacterium]|nr:caspase family protein [Syntrophales bacterium]
MTRKRRMNDRLMILIASLCLLAVFSANVMAVEAPDIFVQLGHRSSDVMAAALSGDGKYLVTGSGDRAAKLWDASSGTEIRTFAGHASELEAVTISADGSQVLSGDKNGVIKLWDTMSGREIRSMAVMVKDPAVKALRFSPGGRFFTSLTSSTLAVWDLNTGRTIRTTENIRGHFACDRGEIYVAAKIGYGDDFVLLELATGKEVKTFGKTVPWFIFASFAADGKYGLFAADDFSLKKYVFGLFDMDTGEKISTWQRDRENIIHNVALSREGTKAILATGGGIEIVDARTGAVAKVLTNSSTFFIQQSPDGASLVSSGLYVPTLWDAASGKAIRHYGRRPMFRNESAQYHPDGKQIFVIRRDAPPLLIDAATGRVDHVFTGYTGGYFQAGGRYVWLSGEKDRRELWDVTTRKAVRQFQAKDVRLPKDGKYLAEKISDNSFRISEAASGKEVLNYSDSEKIHHFFISSDNRYLFLMAGNRIKLVDIAAGREERSFSDPGATKAYGAQTSPDGRYLVGFYDDPVVKTKCRLKIWDMAANREIATFRNVRSMLYFTFSPDGRSVLFGNHNENNDTDTLSLIDVATGRLARTFKGRGILWEMQFSDDGRLLAAGDADGGIVIWDAATGRERVSCAAHKNGVRTIGFSPDGRQIISTGDDGPAIVLDTAMGAEIARFLSFPDGEWITMTPEGYFNASANGAKHLNVRVGNQAYSIDHFFETFFNPRYVASALQGRKVEATADIRQGIQTPPEVRIVSPLPGSEFSTDTVSVQISVKDTGGGIDEVRLYHNGKAVGGDTRALKIVPGGAGITKEYRVLLVDGDNTFKAVGFSRDRTESHPAELIVRLSAPAKEISLYVVAVGINRYRNQALNLNYAQPDARGVAGFFRKNGQRLFKKVEVTEIYNEQATKANIVARLKQLQASQPQDAVVLYLAGHGENVSDKWYFLPYELAYPEREEEVKNKGLSSAELAGIIREISAQKILVLIDSCKSGAALIAFRGFEDRKALAQLSRSIGVHVIAASTKDQYAAEVKELGHGVFTHTLLEGLQGKAAGGGKTVTVLKLKTYLDEELPELTRKYKNEAQFPVADMRGMDFPLTLIQGQN